MQPGPPKYSSYSKPSSKLSLAPGQVIPTARDMATAEASKGRDQQNSRKQNRWVICRALPTSSQPTPSHSLPPWDRRWLPQPRYGTGLLSITSASAQLYSSSPCCPVWGMSTSFAQQFSGRSYRQPQPWPLAPASTSSPGPGPGPHPCQLAPQRIYPNKSWQGAEMKQPFTRLLGTFSYSQWKHVR